MKVVLLNAPPRAGKDTAAAGIVSSFQAHSACGHPLPYVACLHKMAESLKKGAHALFGVDRDSDWLEQHKDTPLPEFMNKTPRQVYIDLSEKFVKPFYGKQAFGWMFVNRVRTAERLAEITTGLEYLCVCSDLGFVDELAPLIAAFGADNILIIQISRDDCAFETEAVKDSRSYITAPGIQTISLINDGTVKELHYKAYQFTLSWLRGFNTNANQTTTTQTCMA